MMSGFQLISHMPLLVVSMPAGPQYLFSFIIQISSFQFFSVDTVLNSVFNTSSEANATALNDQFDSMQYNSRNAIANLGLLFFMLVLALFLTL